MKVSKRKQKELNKQKELELLNKKETDEELYSLKTDAVETLAKAIENNEVKEVKEDRQNEPYHVDRLSKIPSWIKILFVKYWTAGAICFFFMWGLGLYISDSLDMLVITGIALGIINDALVNTAFLYFETPKKEYHKYMLLPVPFKKWWSILINIPIGLLEVIGINEIYEIINQIIINIKGLGEDAIVLGVEPLLFGLFYLIINGILLLIKNAFVKIYQDADKKALKIEEEKKNKE